MTLIELLAVVAIIATLAGLLLPAVGRARRTPRSAVCMSNQRQISLAFQQYIADNRDSYPIHHTWASYGGDWGVHEGGGGATPPNQRPLNKYVSQVKLFRCPADKGYSTQTINNKGRKLTCFVAFGNSYIVPHGFDNMRVKHVTGVTAFSEPQPHNIPIKGSDIALSPANKLIQGDWPWYSTDDSSSEWHEGSGNIVLFGDGHVGKFTLSTASEADLMLPPDPTWKWW